MLKGVSVTYSLEHCLTSSCSASRFFASAALARAALLFRAFFDGDLMEECRPSSGERPIVAAARLLVPAASTSTSTSSSVWRARFAAFLGASAAAPAAAAASGQLPAHHGQFAGVILRPSHSPPPGSWQTQQQPRSVVVAVSCGRCRFASRAEPPPAAAATTAAAAATNAAAAHSAFAAVIAASLH